MTGHLTAACGVALLLGIGTMPAARAGQQDSLPTSFLSAVAAALDSSDPARQLEGLMETHPTRILAITKMAAKMSQGRLTQLRSDAIAATKAAKHAHQNIAGGIVTAVLDEAPSATASEIGAVSTTVASLAPDQSVTVLDAAVDDIQTINKAKFTRGTEIEKAVTQVTAEMIKMLAAQTQSTQAVAVFDSAVNETQQIEKSRGFTGAEIEKAVTQVTNDLVNQLAAQVGGVLKGKILTAEATDLGNVNPAAGPRGDGNPTGGGTTSGDVTGGGLSGNGQQQYLIVFATEQNPNTLSDH